MKNQCLSLAFNSLAAPGRLDAVEHVLARDSYFKRQVKRSAWRTIYNRRGSAKKYSSLTIDLVRHLADQGIDALCLRKDEIIGQAFEFFALRDELRLVA